MRKIKIGQIGIAHNHGADKMSAPFFIDIGCAVLYTEPRKILRK